MPKSVPPVPPDEPLGDAAKGSPDNGRARTEAVLEQGLPPDQQRKPQAKPKPVPPPRRPR